MIKSWIVAFFTPIIYAIALLCLVCFFSFLLDYFLRSVNNSKYKILLKKNKILRFLKRFNFILMKFMGNIVCTVISFVINRIGKEVSEHLVWTPFSINTIELHVKKTTNLSHRKSNTLLFHKEVIEFIIRKKEKIENSPNYFIYFKTHNKIICESEIERLGYTVSHKIIFKKVQEFLMKLYWCKGKNIKRNSLIDLKIMHLKVSAKDILKNMKNDSALYSKI